MNILFPRHGSTDGSASRFRGCLLLLTAFFIQSFDVCAADADTAFFNRHRHLLQIEWTQPFGYESVRSNHAPLAPYLGNGDVGVIAYTAANRQTLRIAKVDFVTDGWNDWAGNGAAALPIGELSITVGGEIGGNFHYTMDQLSATLTMVPASQPETQMSTWLTPDENFIITEVQNISAEDVRLHVGLLPLQHPDCGTSTTVNGDIAQVARRTKCGENVRWVAQAGISTRVIGTENTECRTGYDGNSSGKGTEQEFVIKAGERAYIATYISGTAKTDDPKWEEAREKLAMLTPKTIGKWRKAHQEWWGRMWKRSYVDTGDALLNQQYLTSIYLMASAYRPQSPSCGGMYGVWNMEDDMMYHGDIHLNYNSQSGFYSVFSANRPELALPFFDFLERVAPEGRRRAQEEMGMVHPSLQGKRCRGMLFPVSALGIGEFYGEYWQQTMDAPFNIPLWNWYYEYTGDTDFLRKRAYPFIRECGDFYEDYLQKEPFGTTYRYSIITGGHENSWDLNPPSDVAFVELTFRLLLRYSELLDTDHERRGLWRDILDHLPGYRVISPTQQPNEGRPVFAKNEDGWDMPAHAIQMHCAYPCETLNLHSDQRLQEIGRNTLYYYGVSQQGFTETMNELGLSAFVMGARLGFSPDILLEKLRVLSARHGKNLLITDGHHCLEKTAIVETLNSMMLQSVEGTLHFFPCWPATPASFTRLRTKGAFVVSADFDGHSVRHIEVTSGKSNVCRIRNPWPGRNVSVKSGRHNVTFEHDGTDIVFPTREGSVYDIRPQ